MKKVLLACVIVVCFFTIFACSTKKKESPATPSPTNTPKQSGESLTLSASGEGITIHYPEGWENISQEGLLAVHKSNEAMFNAMKATGAGIAFGFINDDLIKKYAETQFSDVEITDTQKRKFGLNDGYWISMKANNAGTGVQVDCAIIKNDGDLIIAFASAEPENYPKYCATFASMLEAVAVS